MKNKTIKIALAGESNLQSPECKKLEVWRTANCTIQELECVSNLPDYIRKCEYLVNFGLFFLLLPLHIALYHLHIDYTLSIHKGSSHSVSSASEPLLFRSTDNMWLDTEKEIECYCYEMKVHEIKSYFLHRFFFDKKSINLYVHA